MLFVGILIFPNQVTLNLVDKNKTWLQMYW